MNALTLVQAQGKLHISTTKLFPDWKLQDAFMSLNAGEVISITASWLLALTTNELGVRSVA